MTRWPPRTVWSAPRIASRPRAVALEQLLALAARLGRCRAAGARWRCTRRRGGGPPPGRARSPASRAGRGTAGRPAIRARRARMRGELAAERRRGPRRGGGASRRGSPSSGSTSAASRCSASSTGLCVRSASCWAATMASWAFSVNRSSCMVRFSLRSVQSVDGRDQVVARGSGWSTRSRNAVAAAARVVVEVGRQHDPDLHVQVAGAVVLHPGHALAGEPERPAALGAGGDREQDPALEGRDRHLARRAAPRAA